MDMGIAITDQVFQFVVGVERKHLPHMVLFLCCTLGWLLQPAKTSCFAGLGMCIQLAHLAQSKVTFQHHLVLIACHIFDTASYHHFSATFLLFYKRSTPCAAAHLHPDHCRLNGDDHVGVDLISLLQCRWTYEAKSASVQAVAAALKETSQAEEADMISDLKAELAAARSSEAKSAARAKAERQNAHTTGRERAQSELKEVLADQYALQLRCWLACSAQTCFWSCCRTQAQIYNNNMSPDPSCNIPRSKGTSSHYSMSPPGAQRPESLSPL